MKDYQIGDMVMFKGRGWFGRWRRGVVAAMSPLRVRANDTGNLTTNPPRIRGRSCAE